MSISSFKGPRYVEGNVTKFMFLNGDFYFLGVIQPFATLSSQQDVETIKFTREHILSPFLFAVSLVLNLDLHLDHTLPGSTCHKRMENV